MELLAIGKCTAWKVANFPEQHFFVGVNLLQRGLAWVFYISVTMKNKLIPLFIFLPLIVQSQHKFDYIWLLGYPTEEPIQNYGVNIFNFNDQSLDISSQYDGLGMYFTNASICNEQGELLFYSNGCSINNAQNELMENGDGLNPGSAYLSGNCPDNGNSVIKGLIILPLPNDQNKYYVFHKSYVDGVGADLYIGKLYYSIVDMGLSNGLGKVIAKNQMIINDSLHSSDLQAVKHENGIDWWIISGRRNNNVFYKVLFTANGISAIDTQSIGAYPDVWTNASGMASFSPDGTKFARYSRKDQVMLYNFDRSTGELSNFQQLYADTTQGFRGGLSFSSNSRFLYVSTQFKLFQFDMLASDVQASKVLIDEWDGFTESGFSVMFFLMQLAPDCKIYMIPVNGTRNMHVINKPNEPGLACDFRQHGISLPAPNHSIPNFPNYRLGTGYPVCDSNIVYVSGSGFVSPPTQRVRLWPNPASEELNLDISAGTGKAVQFRLFDATGRLTREWKLEGSSGEQALNLHGLAAGLYFWRVETADGSLGSGKLIVIK